MSDAEAARTLPVAHLCQWLQRQQQLQTPAWQQGHQGQILRYREAGWDLVIKAPHGRGLRGYWSRWALRHEYRAYQQLVGVSGVPRCHGLLVGDYLVLDYIPASPFRATDIADREAWFDALLQLIEQIHQRGVAHGDLKRKANLLVTAQGQPVVVDFGAAWLRQPGFRPLNAYLFRFLCRTDLNAYIKHKYYGRYRDVSATDRAYLSYSRLEGWINAWRHRRERRRKRSAQDEQ